MSATPPPPVLIDSEQLMAAADGIVTWFEWFASAGRPELSAADYERHLAAVAPLEPIARLAGPIGDAAHILLVGGTGYASRDIHHALDVLDRLVRPERATPAPWHTPTPPASPAGWVEVPLPGF